MWLWLGVGWLVCAAAVLVLERIRAAANEGLWDREGHDNSFLRYGISVALAPVGLIILVPVVYGFGGKRVWAAVTGKPYDRLAEPATEWLDQDPTYFVGDLVIRRQCFDPRLKGEKLREWPGWRFRDTTDAMILHVVTDYHELRDAGEADEDIWGRLDENKMGARPSPCDLPTYVNYRLRQDDPDYLSIGERFVSEQIAYCEKYAACRAKKREPEPWPPMDWCDKKISLSECERILNKNVPPSAKVSPSAKGGLAGRMIHTQISRVKKRMMPGDELWTFSSPSDYWQALAGRAGVVLIRNGRPIWNHVTLMN